MIRMSLSWKPSALASLALLACAMTLPPSFAHAADSSIVVRQDDGSVLIETLRYRVVLKDGLFTSLFNKLADEEMCGQSIIDFSAGKNEAYAPGIGCTPLKNESASFRKWISKNSAVRALRTSPHAVDVIYTGLSDRKGKRYEDEVAFHLAVDEPTQDLLIRMSCRTQSPGISDLIFSFPSLKSAVTAIVPLFWGGELAYEDFVGSGYTLRWPSFSNGLRFQMGILRGEKGTCMIWSEDSEVMQGKNLYWNCYADTPGIACGAENIQVPVETQTTMETVTWRLNTFGPDWRDAADRYRAHLDRAYRLKEIKASRPRSARELQVLLRMPNDDDAWFDALRNSRLDLDRCVFIMWGHGWWTTAAERAQLHGGHFWKTDWPPNRLRHAKDGNQPDLPERIRKIRDMGAHVAIFTPHNLLGKKHALWSRPEYSDMIMRHVTRDRMHLGAPETRAYLIEQLKDLFENLDVDGVYIDTMGTTWRFFRFEQMGQPLKQDILYNGMTYDKGVEIHSRELVQAPFMRDKIIFGECVNELDLAGIDMAIAAAVPWNTKESMDRVLKRAHPLCAYLASDCVKLTAHGSAWANRYTLFHRELDCANVSGMIPVVYANRAEDIANPLQEHKLILEKAVWFSSKNLTRFFPKDLDESVAAYYRGNDGAEYRFTRDRGRGFVQMTAEGPKTIFHRIHGVAAFEGNGHIDDWVCYDGGKAIGLDPDKYYCYFRGAPETSVSIIALPAGWRVADTRQTDQYIAVRFMSGNPQPGMLRFIANEPLAAVYADGTLLSGSMQADAEATWHARTPGEMVFLKATKPFAPIPSILSPGRYHLHTIMANGFSMRPTNTYEDPQDVAGQVEGATRKGIFIKAIRSHYFHEYARTHIDFCGTLNNATLKLAIEPRKAGAMRKAKENTGNLLRVHLDGKEVFEGKPSDAGGEFVVVPLEVAEGGMPHLLSISYEGNPVVIYPELEAK